MGFPRDYSRVFQSSLSLDWKIRSVKQRDDYIEIRVNVPSKNRCQRIRIPDIPDIPDIDKDRGRRDADGDKDLPLDLGKKISIDLPA